MPGEGSEALQAWAWDQTIAPDEKLALLALCTGELEPDVADVKRRTGMGDTVLNNAVARLQERELVDDDFRPIGPFK